MRPTEGWEKVLQFISSTGGCFAEIYADSCSRTEFTFASKNSRVRSFVTGGTQLVVQSESGPQTFLSNINHPPSFLNWLKGEDFSISRQALELDEKDQLSLSEKNKILDQAFRKTLLDQPDIKTFRATYVEEVKSFLFASADQPIKTGKESNGLLLFDFDAGNGIKQKAFQVKKGRTELSALFADLEHPWLPRFNLEKALQEPWPAPKGNLPVVWSAAALSKLLLCLIRYLVFHSRELEAQKFLEQQFTGFRFQLIDNWKEENRVDAEGNKREATLLVDGDKVPYLLNHQTAGFSRRKTHRDYPVTAPWEPALFGIERAQSLLSQLTHGISIHDIDILNFDPRAGLIQFRTREASLIHQGIEGEHIESFSMELPIIHLFKTFQLFSEHSSPHPLSWHQGSQELFVETTVPDALSPDLNIPGSVPSSHYW